jgi:hypothetical protein
MDLVQGLWRSPVLPNFEEGHRAMLSGHARGMLGRLAPLFKLRESLHRRVMSRRRIRTPELRGVAVVVVVPKRLIYQGGCPIQGIWSRIHEQQNDNHDDDDDGDDDVCGFRWLLRTDRE